MSGPPTNTLPAISQPIVIETDGVFGQLPTGGIINAGGTSNSSFTVGGKNVLVQGIVGSTNICTGYTFSQSTAATVWAINHNGNTLNVVISIYDSTNNQIFPSAVSIVDANNVQISFSAAQAGSAKLIMF